MKVTSLILDFDGVLGNTHQVYVDFLVKKLKFSPKRAELKMQKSATEIVRKDGTFLGSLAERWYYWNFFRFLKTYDNLLFEDRAREIQAINLPKAILTRSYDYICEFILQDYAQDFELIVGKEKASNKVIGLELILANPKFNKQGCIFITDTAADIVEVSKVLPLEQIYAVDWGFNERDFLKKYLPEKQILHADFSGLLEII